MSGRISKHTTEHFRHAVACVHPIIFKKRAAARLNMRQDVVSSGHMFGLNFSDMWPHVWSKLTLECPNLPRKNIVLSYFFVGLKEEISDENYDNNCEILLNIELPILSK